MSDRKRKPKLPLYWHETGWNTELGIAIQFTMTMPLGVSVAIRRRRADGQWRWEVGDDQESDLAYPTAEAAAKDCVAVVLALLERSLERLRNPQYRPARTIAPKAQ